MKERELKEHNLIAALSKYWRPLTEDEYLDKMDIPMTNAAIKLMWSSLTKEQAKSLEDWIWKIERKPFEIF